MYVSCTYNCVCLMYMSYDMHAYTDIRIYMHTNVHTYRKRARKRNEDLRRVLRSMPSTFCPSSPSNASSCSSSARISRISVSCVRSRSRAQVSACVVRACMCVCVRVCLSTHRRTCVLACGTILSVCLRMRRGVHECTHTRAHTRTHLKGRDASRGCLLARTSRRHLLCLAPVRARECMCLRE